MVTCADISKKIPQKVIPPMTPEIVTPEDFGAIGNGIADDSGALRLAFDSGYAVFLNQGKTYMFSTLLIPSNLKLFGYGTLKRLATANITTGEHWAIRALDSENWSIEEITIDGNKLHQDGRVGFKISGMLIRGCRDFRIEGVIFKDWQNDCIEMTCAGQGIPLNDHTPPPDQPDTIYRGKILGCSFLDSGRNVDDGFGYSNSRALQVGSTCVDITIANNLIRNCLGGVQSGAYNRHLVIANNSLYIDPVVYPFVSTGLSAEQLCTNCVIEGNVIEGYREGVLLESCIGVACVGNRIKGADRGINCFASSISGVLTILRQVTVSGNTIEVNSVLSDTCGIRAVSGGDRAYENVITGNTVNGGQFGIRTVGNTGVTVTGNNVRNALTGISSEENTDSLVASNNVHQCTGEGLYVGPDNVRVAVVGNKVSGCDKGVDTIGAQTNVYIYANYLLNNTTDNAQDPGPPT